MLNYKGFFKRFKSEHGQDYVYRTVTENGRKFEMKDFLLKRTIFLFFFVSLFLLLFLPWLMKKAVYASARSVCVTHDVDNDNNSKLQLLLFHPPDKVKWCHFLQILHSKDGESSMARRISFKGNDFTLLEPFRICCRRKGKKYREKYFAAGWPFFPLKWRIVVKSKWLFTLPFSEGFFFSILFACCLRMLEKEERYISIGHENCVKKNSKRWYNKSHGVERTNAESAIKKTNSPSSNSKMKESS